MGTSKLARKAYRPRPNAAKSPLRRQPWLVVSTFDLLGEILRHIARDGTLELNGDDELIYRAKATGKEYAVVPAITACADILGIVAMRKPGFPRVDPLRSLAGLLELGEMEEHVIESALACFTAWQAVLPSLSPAELSDAAQTAALRSHLDGLDSQAHPGS